MPAAKSIANQDLSPNSGSSSSLPRTIEPIGESAIQKEKATNDVTTRTYHQPRSMTTVLLAFCSRSPRPVGKIAAAAEKTTRITAAGMKTRGAAIGKRRRAAPSARWGASEAGSSG